MILLAEALHRLHAWIRGRQFCQAHAWITCQLQHPPSSRLRSACGGPSRMIRPSRMKPTRVQRIASSIYGVLTSTARSPCASSGMISRQKSWRVTGSTPVVGSSKQQHLGLVDQRNRQPEFLLHAAGKLAGTAVQELRKANELQYLTAALAPLCGRQPAHLGKEAQVFLHRQIFVQGKALRQVAQSFAPLLRRAQHIEAGQRHLACVWVQRAAQQPD